MKSFLVTHQFNSQSLVKGELQPLIKICTYCEAYYNADTPLGEENIVVTLLGENNAPSVATGLGVSESAAESKFMLIQ